jgi:hypothetical protein
VNNSATISTSEYSLPGNTSSGVPTAQTDDCILQAWIDFGAMTASEQYEVKLYETINGGTQRLVETWILTGVQSKPALALPSMIVGEGWDLTVKKLAGTDRSIGWSLRKVT